MMSSGSVLSLFAKLETASSVRTYVHHSRSSGQIVFLVTLVAAAAGLWVAIYWWDRQRQLAARAASGRAGKLFEQLCRGHQLSPADRQLLEQAADRCEIAQPALLFLDASLLGRLSHAPQAEAAAEAERYAALARKLFAEQDEEQD